MKHCNICHRELITKKHAGLCAGCFANVRDIIIIFLIPLVCFLYIISPIDIISEFIMKYTGPVFWIGFIDDGVSILVGLFFQIKLLIGVIKRKRAL